MLKIKNCLIKGITMLILVSLVSCGSKSKGSTDKIELTMMTNFSQEQVSAINIEEIVRAFETENPNISVELTSVGEGYESLLKAKMATNQLPDLWTTHGWANRRYSEYLLDLKDQAWAKDLHPAIKPIITGSKGEVWVLPMDVDISGIVYNKNVLTQANINVDDLKTWDDLLASMQILKEKGIIATTLGGKDSWTVGNFYDWIAPAFYIMTTDNEKANLLDGKFNQMKWKEMSNLLKTMKDKGYFNTDAVTSTYMDSVKALSTGQAAYAFLGNGVITEALTYNPDVKLGFFPIPALNPSDKPFLISGERTAVGVWKDSKHPEEALKLLNFLARPENVAKVATGSITPAGLANISSDTGLLQDDYNKYKDAPVTGFFDREYLPNGIWDSLTVTGIGILAGSMSVEEATEEITSKFNQLYGQ